MQSQTTTFLLDVSGYPISIPNGTEDATSISLAYIVSGSTSVSISVEGVSLATGSQVLDNHTGGSTTRTISLSSTFDFFRVTGTWTGSGVSVNGALSASGNGASFESSDLSAIQTFSA